MNIGKMHYICYQITKKIFLKQKKMKTRKGVVTSEGADKKPNKDLRKEDVWSIKLLGACL